MRRFIHNEILARIKAACQRLNWFDAVLCIFVALLVLTWCYTQSDAYARREAAQQRAEAEKKREALKIAIQALQAIYDSMYDGTNYVFGNRTNRSGIPGR